MPIISFVLGNGSAVITVSKEKSEIHRVSAIAKLGQCSHVISDGGLENGIGIEIEFLKISELNLESRKKVGCGCASWFKSAIGSPSALGHHTIGLVLYLQEGAFNLVWSSIQMQKTSNLRIIVEVDDDSNVSEKRWNYDLACDYPIKLVQIGRYF